MPVKAADRQPVRLFKKGGIYATASNAKELAKKVKEGFSVYLIPQDSFLAVKRFHGDLMGKLGK